MAFTRETLAPIETGGRTSIWAYKTDDTSINVLSDGYFNDAADVLEQGSGIIVMSQFGTIIVYVSSIEEGDVNLQVRNTPTLEGEVLGQNEITTAEINATLTSYGIDLPLLQSMTLTIHDITSQPDKAFMCTYDKNIDQWYYEKLEPCP